MAGALLAALTAVANECQAAAQSFSDEHAIHGLAVAEELRAIFLLRLAPAQPSPTPLAVLPVELVSVILSHLDTPDLSRLAATCRSIWLDAPAAPPPQLPPRPIGAVEVELRRRAKARCLDTASFLSLKELSRGCHTF